MLNLLVIPYMAVCAGWSGGSLIGHKLFGRFTFIPEILFSLGFAYAWLDWDVPVEVYSILPLTFPSWAFTALGLSVKGLFLAIIAIWSYAWMQSATGPALQWGTDPEGMGKPRTLSPLVNWCSDKLGFKRGDVNYCRLWMFWKGLLIGLPVGGLPLALGWPLSYEVGFRAGNRQVIKECLSGAFAGASILIFRAFSSGA